MRGREKRGGRRGRRRGGKRRGGEGSGGEGMGGKERPYAPPDANSWLRQCLSVYVGKSFTFKS